ncbi:cell division protein FtsZ [Candidatus Kaiserbacteria bacterium]|nr:cell division protein FtsZ [Candidatus Kaiserbacteria bacterium]
MPQVHSEMESAARIRVIGVGGSGKNAINHMVASKVKGVDFLVINTDAQDLQQSAARMKIHIGKNLTRGLGAGMNPAVGKRAAEETQSEIQDALRGSDMVFIAGGMGGGTCTGAAPIVARIAKESGALTVAVVTKPFSFEGQQRMRLAEQGMEELRKEVDALIVIPNDRLLAVVDSATTVKSAFAMCDEVLRQAVEGVSDLITTPGNINLDFADIKAIMEDAGSALMGVGLSIGDKRAEEAARLAINSPLLDISINGAKGVLLSIAGGEDLSLLEVQAAAQIVTESIDKNAKVIFGTSRDDRLKKGEVRVTVIATGFPEDGASRGGQSLFQLGGKKEKKEDEPMSKIYTAPAREEEVVLAKQEPAAKPAAADDDDDWGAVPAFLRRSKKN